MQATILKLMTEILALMSLMVSQVQAPATPVVSSEPYLPKTSYVVPADRLGAYNPTAGGTYRTQSSIGLSDVTITLSSFKEPISNLKYTMSYLNSSIEYGTIEPSNQTNKEFVSFTGITQNADGTATLTGVSRGLGFSYPYTASTTLVRTHSGQSVFILSNPPQLTNQYANKNNTESIDGVWTFNASPILPTPTTATQGANKSYVDGVAVAGAPNADTATKGIVQTATALQVASSTSLGSTGASLYIPASNATSTYNSATAPLKVVVTQNNGKIDPNFTDYTANRTWVGTNLFQASTTMVATTTIGASSITNNALRLNGVPYAFPSAQGAASTTLQNDGSGNLSWLGYSKLLTTVPSATFTCIGGLSSSTIYSLTIPANTLGVNKSVRITTTIMDAGFNASDQIAIEAGFGTASTTAIFSQPNITGIGSGNGLLTLVLSANGATNSQIMNINSTTKNISGSGKGASFSQDSTSVLKLMVVGRNITNNAPGTCGTTIAEIIQ